MAGYLHREFAVYQPTFILTLWHSLSPAPKPCNDTPKPCFQGVWILLFERSALSVEIHRFSPAPKSPISRLRTPTATSSSSPLGAPSCTPTHSRPPWKPFGRPPGTVPR